MPKSQQTPTSLDTLNSRQPEHNHCVALKEQATSHTWFTKFNSTFMETSIVKVTMVDSLFSFFKLILWSVWSVVRVVRASRVGTGKKRTAQKVRDTKIVSEEKCMSQNDMEINTGIVSKNTCELVNVNRHHQRFANKLQVKTALKLRTWQKLKNTAKFKKTLESSCAQQ